MGGGGDGSSDGGIDTSAGRGGEELSGGPYGNGWDGDERGGGDGEGGSRGNGRVGGERGGGGGEGGSRGGEEGEGGGREGGGGVHEGIARKVILLGSPATEMSLV